MLLDLVMLLAGQLESVGPAEQQILIGPQTEAAAAHVLVGWFGLDGQQAAKTVRKF